MIARSRLALLVALLLAGTACSRKRPDVAPPPTPQAATPVADSDDRERLERERLERERAEREAAARARREEIQRVLSVPVYFGFDRYDLSADAREILEAKWGVLTANPALRLRIAGHADELGSDEYNLALGMQRAAAVKRFFTQRDVADGRLEIISFGEEQPVCADPGEACRSRNRRAEFQITAGLDAVAQRGGA